MAKSFSDDMVTAFGKLKSEELTNTFSGAAEVLVSLKEAYDDYVKADTDEEAQGAAIEKYSGVVNEASGADGAWKKFVDVIKIIDKLMKPADDAPAASTAVDRGSEDNANPDPEIDR